MNHRDCEVGKQGLYGNAQGATSQDWSRVAVKAALAEREERLQSLVATLAREVGLRPEDFA